MRVTERKMTVKCVFSVWLCFVNYMEDVNLSDIYITAKQITGDKYNNLMQQTHNEMLSSISSCTTYT